MTNYVVELLLGLAILMAGNEVLLRGLVNLKRAPGRLAVLGITYTGSIPRLIVGLQSASGGSPDMALGMVIGGVISNLLLLFGLAALSGRLRIMPVFKRDSWLALIAALLLLACCSGDTISRLRGLALCLAMVAVIWYMQRTAGIRPPVSFAGVKRTSCRLCALAYSCIGAGLLFTGADVLVDAGSAVGELLQLPEAITGLTVIALVTSLPLLVSIISAMQTRNDEQVMALLLSNTLFLLLFVAGLSAVLVPLPVAVPFSQAISGMMAVCLLSAVIVNTHKNPGKVQGIVLIALYLATGVYELFFSKS